MQRVLIHGGVLGPVPGSRVRRLQQRGGRLRGATDHRGQAAAVLDDDRVAHHPPVRAAAAVGEHTADEAVAEQPRDPSVVHTDREHAVATRPARTVALQVPQAIEARGVDGVRGRERPALPNRRRAVRRRHRGWCRCRRGRRGRRRRRGERRGRRRPPRHRRCDVPAADRERHRRSPVPVGDAQDARKPAPRGQAEPGVSERRSDHGDGRELRVRAPVVAGHVDVLAPRERWSRERARASRSDRSASSSPARAQLRRATGASIAHHDRHAAAHRHPARRSRTSVGARQRRDRIGRLRSVAGQREHAGRRPPQERGEDCEHADCGAAHAKSIRVRTPSRIGS